MSGLDLGNPKDFAKATQGAFGATAGVLALFSGGIEDWDIQEASYVSNSSAERGKDPIVFHVFESKQDYQGALSEVQDTGGRRKVTYLFPYRDGQTTDDLGRDAETFSLSVVLHGPRYLSAYKKLFRELNKPEPGILIHPVRGPLECVLDDFTITHKSETRQAMTISLNFMEHNFTIGDLSSVSEDPTVKSSLSRALQIFEDVNNAIANVRGALIFAQEVKNALGDALDAYSAAYAEILNKMNVTFNGGGSVDIPSLIPLNEGGSTSDNFIITQSPNDPFANVPVEQLNPDTIGAITTLQLEKETNQRREDLNAILEIYKETPESELEFFEDIKNLKASAIALEEVLESGKASSRTKIINYEIPKVMSIREAIYRNGVSLDRLSEVEILNPNLESVNFIEEGTVLRIPK